MTLDDLQQKMLAAGTGGITLYFGPSVCKARKGQWFANTGPLTPQVYADTLHDALAQLFQMPSVDDEELLV